MKVRGFVLSVRPLNDFCNQFPCKVKIERLFIPASLEADNQIRTPPQNTQTTNKTMESILSTTTPEKPIRGRKPTIQIPEMRVTPTLQTFHHNASEECANILSEFAMEHREDKNKQFKMAWQQWILEPRISAILSTELNVLRESGYQGDPMEKMYFSARYYYRKKALKEQLAQVEECYVAESPKQRKKYELADKDTLEQINAHIIKKLFGEKDAAIISPANAFAAYCETHNVSGIEEERLKKIYKNRFFVLRKKSQEKSSKCK